MPIALTSLSATTLNDTSAANLIDMAALVPSLQLIEFNPRNANLTIRGLGSNVAIANDGLETGVGVYVDGVYYARPGESMFDFFDLDRVEVLRGPQGTLFGKNTTAGAVTISSAPPTFTPEGSAEVSVGNYGYYQLRGGAVSGSACGRQDWRGVFPLTIPAATVSCTMSPTANNCRTTAMPAPGRNSCSRPATPCRSASSAITVIRKKIAA